MSSISQGDLKSLLRYDPQTGVFTWLRGKRAGMVAGNVVKGHRQIMIGGKNYAAHRLAWLYVTGKFPNRGIDHINLNGDDNRFHNLREASQSQNGANQRLRKNSTSGLKGVTWRAEKRKWVAQITVDWRNNYLGIFDCPAAAHFRYLIEADKRFGEFARAA